MNIKKILTITILMIFIVGICISAADAAHTVKKDKYKAKLTNKEYKKLTKTQTKYKKVKKYKTVKKTRTIKQEIPITETKTYNYNVKSHYDKINTSYKSGNIVWYPDDYWNPEFYQITKYNQTANKNITYNGSKYHICNEEYWNLTMNVTTGYEYKTVKENYTVKEAYYIKEPYKVRVKAELQKTVGYKKVKLDQVVGHKYKTVYEYKTVKLKQIVYNAKTDTYTNYRGTHQKYLWKDWNLVKTITQYKSDGSYIAYDVIKSKKKVAVKQTIPIIKAVKTKKPILMNIRTTNSANRLLQGKKVYVELYCNGNLLGKGTVNMK